MQIYTRLVWLLLIFVFTLISARNIDFDSDHEEQRRDAYYRQLSGFAPRGFYNLMSNEHFIPYQHEGLAPIIRRAKAIVKGDPREFMG